MEGSKTGGARPGGINKVSTAGYGPAALPREYEYRFTRQIREQRGWCGVQREQTRFRGSKEVEANKQKRERSER